MTVKDAYSLPQIQDMLECLHGAVWFRSLDPKSRHWHVRMKEECKAYTAFILDQLAFYECKCMLFGLTNAPATFQHLTETCLRDLQLNWYIIYPDIIVFATIPKENLKSCGLSSLSCNRLGSSLSLRNVSSLKWRLYILGM